jgi:hypothetical protein
MLWNKTSRSPTASRLSPCPAAAVPLTATAASETKGWESCADHVTGYASRQRIDRAFPVRARVAGRHASTADCEIPALQLADQLLQSGSEILIGLGLWRTRTESGR